MGQQKTKVGGGGGGDVYVPGVGVVSEQEASQIEIPQEWFGAQGAPGQHAGFQMPAMSAADRAGVSHGIGTVLAQAAPMAAGALNMVPPLNTVGASFMVPTVVETLRQLLSGEQLDPARSVTEGTLGVGAHGLGRALEIVPKFGASQIRAVLDRGTLGPEASTRIVKTATREGADLSPEGIRDLLQRAIDYENRGTSMQGGVMLRNRGLMLRAANAEELAKRLQTTSMAGGGSMPIPRFGMRPGGGFLSAGVGDTLTPRARLNMGVSLARSHAPQIGEGGLRAILAGLLGMAEPPPQAESSSPAPQRLRFAR